MYQPNDHKLFLELFIKKFNTTPAYHAAQTFAAGQILETAINKTKSFDKNAIRKVLSTMDAISIIGRYKVDHTGMQIRHFQVILQHQTDKKEVVWPESLATAKPMFQ